MKHTAARQIANKDNNKKGHTLQLVKRLARNYLAPYTGQMIIAVAFMAIAGGMTAIIAALMQPVLDDVLYSGKEGLIIPVSLGLALTFAQMVRTGRLCSCVQRQGTKALSDSSRCARPCSVSAVSAR